MSQRMISTEPATGKEIWSGESGDAAAEVAAARAALPEWTARSIAYRCEALRRFANVVRKKEKDFATLISRETGIAQADIMAADADVVVQTFEIGLGGKEKFLIEIVYPQEGFSGIELPAGTRRTAATRPRTVMAGRSPSSRPDSAPKGERP